MAKAKETGGFAFPRPSGPTGEDNSGMTLRDYFAGEAMRALIEISDPLREMGIKATTEKAYRISDAMIEARKN